MSDDIDRSSEEYNISKKYFQEYKPLFSRSGKHVTNFYVSYAPDRALGTFYFIHGYGGSPVEFCLATPMKIALENGFNVVAIESVDLSATARPGMILEDMTLNNHKAGIFRGLVHAAQNPTIYNTYNVSFAHSLGGRAMSDLAIASPQFVRDFFDEDWLVNPYVLPQPRLHKLREALKAAGRWQTQYTEKRTIEGAEYIIPACSKNLYIGLPPMTKRLKKQFDLSPEDLDGIAKNVSKHLSKEKIKVFLGKQDSKADFHQHYALFERLTVHDKLICAIEGADHYMEYENKRKSAEENATLAQTARSNYIDAVRNQIVNLAESLRQR